MYFLLHTPKYLLKLSLWSPAYGSGPVTDVHLWAVLSRCVEIYQCLWVSDDEVLFI